MVIRYTSSDFRCFLRKNNNTIHENRSSFPAVYLEALHGLAWECEALFRPCLSCKHSEFLENAYLN